MVKKYSSEFKEQGVRFCKGNKRKGSQCTIGCYR